MYSVKYDDGLCSYRIEKEINDDKISIIVYDTSFGRNVIIRTITYKNIGKEYSSPFLSWYNLIFCSNNYGPAPNYPYMHSAVQDGKKTARLQQSTLIRTAQPAKSLLINYLKAAVLYRMIIR